MAKSTTYKARALTGALFLCWFSSSSLSSPVFAETLNWRENSHSQYEATGEENPYQARRQQIRAQLALPSPDLLKSPVSENANAPPAQASASSPMKITIPNLKAMEQKGLPSPSLLADENARKPINNVEPQNARLLNAKPLISDDEVRQTVAEFKPVAMTQKQAAAVMAAKFAALSPAAGPADATPLIASPGEINISSKDAVAPTPVEEKKPEPVYENPVAGAALDNALQSSYSDAQSEVPADLPPLEPTAMPKKNKKTSAKQKDPLAAIVKPYSPLDSEPKMNLSPASKSMVSKIPSNIDRPKAKPEGPFNIARAKDTKDLFKGDPALAENTGDTITHEAMGIKIQVKNRQMNLDYELEKAYDALVAGQPSMAMEIYKNILTNDPNNKGALFGLATTYHRSGQLDQARIYYSKLLGVDPDNREGLNNFLVLLADEAPEEALSQMDSLFKRNPNFSPIPAQMAVIYQKLGNTDKASEYMYKAINLAPENLVYRYNLAIMLDKQKKYEEAGRLYKQLIQAAMRGENIPGNLQKIQQRLTFISSNR